jgi:hypothetical protein
MAVALNIALFQRYVESSRELLAYLSSISGENYISTPESEAEINRLRDVSLSVTSLATALHRQQASFQASFQALERGSRIQE